MSAGSPYSPTGMSSSLSRLRAGRIVAQDLFADDAPGRVHGDPVLSHLARQALGPRMHRRLGRERAVQSSGSDLPVMLMMRPHLRSIICGSSRCVSWRWRVKLSVSASSHCASVASSVKRRLPPALLTRMSTDPRPCSASLAIFARAGRKQVAFDDDELDAELALERLEEVAPARDREAHALAGERCSDSATDSHARARDEPALRPWMSSSMKGEILPDCGTPIARASLSLRKEQS